MFPAFSVWRHAVAFGGVVSSPAAGEKLKAIVDEENKMGPYRPLIDKAAVLIEALPYMQAFRDAVVLVKFGGSAMTDAARTESVLRDVVFMEAVGMRPVIVHGGGKAISQRLAEQKIETRFVNGLRYTCEATIKVVDDVLHNEVNPPLVEAIKRYGGRAVGVSGKTVLRGERMRADDGSDIGAVGKVLSVDVAPVREILAENRVPVITPVGIDADGKPLNVNADVAACCIAGALRARKLVFLSDVPGLLADADDEESLISTVAQHNVEKLIEQGIIAGGMVPKLRSAVEALQAGTSKVHLIDGRVQHSLLLEIFTDYGIGTQIIHD